MLGVMTGTCLVYLVCNFLVFRGAAPVVTSMAAASGVSRRPVAMELDEKAVR
jgi:hypothetical protein